MSGHRSHWFHAVITFLLTVLAAGILLPWIRVQPESVHKFFHGLRDWLRIAFVFSFCILFTGVMFKLLSPRIEHLNNCKNHPPAWLAALLAWVLVAIIDISYGFDSDGYRASAWEWLCYGGGSLLIIGLFSGQLVKTCRWIRNTKKLQVKETRAVAIQDIENASWVEIEEWLRSDEIAQHDFLGNRSVANRLGRLISCGTRSVGIVGPFGSGKTSLVKWVAEHLEGSIASDHKYFICHHSCWGFETSASAIHDLLSSALSKLGAEIDTFQVDSLPESYRQAFSSGGDWVETISSLVLRSPDPMKQFRRLSELLGEVKGRIVFIVEDLDRNDSRSFEIQEVLAFLERLKSFANLSFILTGGLSSSRHIDYVKLCDHIEYLRTIQPYHSSGLIDRINKQCLDASAFPHFRLSDPNRNYEWNPLSSLLLRDFEELSVPQAVASLLSTPRSLRHALGRTYSAWQSLHGEINFNHLIAVNVLRFGAPECFQFLLRRWDRLHAPPSRNSAYGQDRITGIRNAIIDDWNCTTQKVEWNPTAAMQIMEFILPATEYWLVDESRYGHLQYGQQHVFEERYWIRAINEAIDESDVRDQEIIRDTKAWLEAPSIASELVTKLTSRAQYSDVWEALAVNLFADQRPQVLLLCEHVLNRILNDQGNAASHESQGFIHTWRFASRHVTWHADNAEWLRQRISEAASQSIEMVNSLWHYYGSYVNSILNQEDREPVRRHEIDTLRSVMLDSEVLSRIISSKYPYVLYQLVFDPGDHNPQSQGDLKEWSWLPPIILDSLRKGDSTVAVATASLIASRESGMRAGPWRVDDSILFEFFSDDAGELVRLMSQFAATCKEEEYQELMEAIVDSSRLAIDERASGRGGDEGSVH